MNTKFRFSSQTIKIPTIRHLIFLSLTLVLTVSACSRRPEINSKFIRKISPPSYYYIDWSPNGSTILAQLMRHVDSDLYLVNINDSGTEKVTDSPGWYDLPKWSPDGSKIALTVGANSIWIYDILSRSFSRLTEGEGAVWFPEGDRLAVYVGANTIRGADHREIRIVDSQGIIHKTHDVGPVSNELLQSNRYLVQPSEYLEGLDISPDGNRLIFSVQGNSGRIGDEPGVYQWEAYSVDLTNDRVLPFLPGESVGQVSWAPDGEEISYIQLTRPGVGKLIIADTKGKCLFIPDLPAEISNPSWAPDSSEMAFLYEGAIYILDTSLQFTLQESGCP